VTFELMDTGGIGMSTGTSLITDRQITAITTPAWCCSWSTVGWRMASTRGRALRRSRCGR
jgi:hypothetical protein